MIKLMALFILVLLAASCAKKYLTNDFHKEVNRLCLNLEGNGRLTVQGHKYVFDAETFWDKPNDKWSMGMGFALHGQEVIELDLKNPDIGFHEKVQRRLLKEKTGIDPETLKLFMARWAAFINEVITLKKDEPIGKPLFAWDLSKEELVATSNIDKDNLVEAKFFVPEEKYFSRMDFLLKPKDDARQIKIELIVRKCLD